MTDPGQIATIVAAIAMLGLHFFRGPNRQYDDLAARIERAENHVSALREELGTLTVKLAERHATRDEVRGMLDEMKRAVDRIQGVVDRLVESQRSKG